MAVTSRTSEHTGRTTHRVRWRLNGKREGAWQSVAMGHTEGHRRQAAALDAWLRDVHGYAVTDDDPRIREFLGLTVDEDDEDDDGRGSTVGALWAEWLARPKLSASARHTYRSAVGNHLGTFADLDVRLVNRRTVNRYLADLAASGKSEWTLHRVVVGLSGALRGHVASDVWADAKFRPERQARVTVLTPEQAAALVTEAKGTALWLPVWLVAETGMRWAEMGGLTAGDIDHAEQKVHVRRQASQTTNSRAGGFKPVRLKTKHSRRTIPISPALADALAPLAGLPADAPAFAPPYAEYWTYNGFVKVWRELTARTPDVPNRMRFHDLRHSAAMRWMRAGVPIGTVSRSLGHSSVQVTDDIYSHWTEADAAAIVGAGLGL